MLHREVSRSTFTDTINVKKTKRSNEDKDYAECIDSKIIKDKRGPGRIRTTDLLFTKGALTTMLQSHVTGIKKYIH